MDRRRATLPIAGQLEWQLPSAAAELEAVDLSREPYLTGRRYRSLPRTLFPP